MTIPYRVHDSDSADDITLEIFKLPEFNIINKLHAD